MKFNPALFIAGLFGFGYTGGGGRDPLNTRVERAAGARQNREARAAGRYYAEDIARGRAYAPAGLACYGAPVVYAVPAVYAAPRVEVVLLRPVCFKLRRGVLHRRG
jgi:hypothetical protein